MDQLDSIKAKNCSLGDTAKKMKMQARDWEKISDLCQEYMKNFITEQ